jgi:hypothetical protein
MKKLITTIAIIVACLMSSMTFATNYYASANVYVVDNSYTSGCSYDFQIGVLTEYPSWTGWVYAITGYLPGTNSFPYSISNITMPGPIPYNPQIAAYYRVLVQVTKHIPGSPNTVVEQGWAYATDQYNGTDYYISANNTIDVTFP